MVPSKERKEYYSIILSTCKMLLKQQKGRITAGTAAKA
jgi:hypothetical protein